MLPTVTLAGRLTRDPELRFSNSGTAVCSFTVVVSDRRKNEASGEWEDVSPTFFRCTAFGAMGENVAESLDKGTNVLVVGKVSERKYTTREGEDRTSYQEVRVEEIGPSVRWNTVAVHDNQAREKSPARTSRAQAAEDPWAV